MTTTPTITFTLKAEQEDTMVRGNAQDSGDAALDKQVEDEIIARLDNGDVWAWCYIVVTASCAGFTGRDTLGGCCYRDEADFKQSGGYYKQMQEEARADLLRNIENAVVKGAKAASLLAALAA